MTLAMNGTINFAGNVLSDIAVARAAGYEAIELPARKTEEMLAAGVSLTTLRDAIGTLEVCNVGAVLNLERGGDDLAAFLAEVEAISVLAHAVGAPMIQLCTGPVDRDVASEFQRGVLAPEDHRYRGSLGDSYAQTVKQAARNIARAAHIAQNHGLDVCIEPLAWTPLGNLAAAIQAIELSDAQNVGLCIDFWHAWAAGHTPAELAALPTALIKGVQVADGTAFDRDHEIADQRRDRDVLVGGGVIPLQEWVDAIKATGYTGWYSTEMFSARGKHLEPVRLATAMLGMLEVLTA